MKAFVVICFLCLFIATRAQDLSDSIETVTIFAIQRIHTAGLSISTIDSTVLKRNPESSLAEIIQSSSPVFIKNYGRGALATAAFRGTAASHTRVSWNGILLNSPMLGQTDFSQIPAVFIDRADILYGGSSLAEGSGALGGAVCLSTSPIYEQGLRSSINFEYGSFGTYGASGSFHAGSKRVQFVTRFVLSTSENDFRYYNTAVLPYAYDNQKNASYNQKAILQEWYYRPSARTIISAKIWVQNDYRQLSKLMSFEGSDTKEEQSNQFIRSIIHASHRISSNCLINLRSAFVVSKINYLRESEVFDYVNNDSRSAEEGSFNRLSIEKGLKKYFFWVSGVDFNHEIVRTFDYSPSINLGYNTSRNNLAAFTRLSAKWSKSSFIFQLREDVYDNTWVPLIPSISGAYDLLRDKRLSINSTLARNYHQASLNDLYWIPGGNPNLKPEEGYSADLGLSSFLKADSFQLRTRLTAYISHIINWIIWQPTTARYWEPVNLWEVLSRGGEFEIKTNYNMRNASFTILGNYAFTRATNLNGLLLADSNRNHQLIYMPIHKYNIRILGSFKKWSGGWLVQYIGKRYTTPDSEASSYEIVLNPHYINDVFLARQFSIYKLHLSLQIKVYNLFNINYQAILFRAMPGRYFSVMLNLKF